MQPSRKMAPTTVTICLSLSDPVLKGNTHTVVFIPSTCTTGKEHAGKNGITVNEGESKCF